jgi:two-component system, NarL family, sensor histidine kinase UhpB
VLSDRPVLDLVGVEQFRAGPAAHDPGELPAEIVTAVIAVFMPVPPLGVTRWAASPTRKVRPCRNRLAIWAADVNDPARSIRGRPRVGGVRHALTLTAMPLLWKVFTSNALVLIAAALLLVLSPATVSFPVALTEAVVLMAGLAAMLGIDLLLLRRAFAPLGRLRRFVRAVDPLQPGARAVVGEADPEVAELAAAVNEMIDRLERERRESARAALSGQESERLRIARELHDEVGQTLTAIMLQLEHAARDTGDADVAEAREGVRSALEEVREIARRLRPEALDDLGLGSALAALTLDVSRRTRLRIERCVAPDLPALTAEEELVIYRVAQEALTNVARHSGARHAWVELAPDDGAVVLSVRDDGSGFDAPTEEATGIRGMRERAVLVGAALAVESAEGTGAAVRLRLYPAASR